MSLIPVLRLPPLLGMLMVGFMLRNVPGINIAGDIDPKWSSVLRNIALTVILIRAGLGLDGPALKKLSRTVLLLSFMPCLVEAASVGVVAHLILGFPWLWAFLLGFVQAAVTPAVLVPFMLNLQVRNAFVETYRVHYSNLANAFRLTVIGHEIGHETRHSDTADRCIQSGRCGGD